MMESAPPAPTLPLKSAWVCAPGVLKVPNLAAFLPEYALNRLPSKDVDVVSGWGLKPSSRAGRTWASRNNKPYVALEDGFLRSVGLGESGATSLSVVVDDLGIYYDATRPSRLEALIDTAPQWCDASLATRARALIDRMVEARISKTNMGGPLDDSILEPRRRVLVVDQTYGDASIAYGLATETRFAEMLAAARTDEPDAQIIVKRHPAVAAGRKQGCIPSDQLSGVTLIDTDVRPAELLDAVDAVYVVTSALGFEALLRGKAVRCFGAPFYSGWGLTRDTVPTGRRGQSRTVEQVVAAAMICYTRYVDPVTGQPCEAEQALERLIALRDRADRLSGDWAAVGFAPAKRPPVRRLLNSPKGRVRYFWHAKSAVAHARATDGKLIWWSGKESPEILATASTFDGSRVRMEDGFIRSRGLGSDFFGALSVALDDQGVYYDPRTPSRLETLIETGGLSPRQRDRAKALREAVVGAGLSKYNLKGSDLPDTWPKDRPVLLVVGQVENDKSILTGCGDIRTNSGLVKAARADFPDAFLVYRNHPDVTSGNRIGLLDAGAMHEVDAVADDMDIIDLLNACDRLATLTSLSGFEALMRGKSVSVYGRPFYAGWGLTDDKMAFERRTRKITLDDLIHAALIDYPVYVTPDGWPCEAEDLVAALIAARDHPLPPPPRGRVRRWWRGIKASLDRSLPPSY